jgi:predicted amidohydrolase
MIQMQVAPGAKAANLDHAAELLAQAAAQGAQVAVLPEAMTLGWTHPAAPTLADEIPQGESCARLCAEARRHRLYICSGLVERAGDLVFNAAVLIGPDGELRLHHRKINELLIAHEYYALGDRLGVVRTPLGVFGIMICADGFAQGQVLARSLALMGTDIILSPSAWAVVRDHDNVRESYGQLWRDNYGPVAREFGIWIAGVSNVGPITAGPWAGRKCIGCSLLMGPEGQPALQGPYGEEAEAILYHDLHLAPRLRPWFEPAH